jgi:hypothetical protein
VKTASSTRTIAFVGDYLPRKCGIATFTSDLLGAVAERGIPKAGASRCRSTTSMDAINIRTWFAIEIEEQDLASYRRAADFLNTSEVDTVSVQHEFGIFGGPAGSHLLTLVARIDRAGCHHAPHCSPRAERRSASCDGGIARALNPGGRHGGAGTDRSCKRFTRCRRPRSISSHMVFPMCRSSLSDYYKDHFGVARQEGLADVRAAFAE